MVLLQSSGYEQWGRPVGMDNQAAGCGPFNNARPVRKFTVSVRVTNNTATRILNSEWYMRFDKGDGSEGFTCFYGYTGGQFFPDIPENSARDVTFAVFVEQNEYVARGYVTTKNQGNSNTLTFK